MGTSALHAHRSMDGVVTALFWYADVRSILMVFIGFSSGTDRMFLPQFMGTLSDCTVGPCPQSSTPLDYPELAGAANEYGEDASATWAPNGEDRAMGWMALVTMATDASPAHSVYVGAHDPDGRMKLLPASVNQAAHTALIRVVHVRTPVGTRVRTYFTPSEHRKRMRARARESARESERITERV